MRRVVGVAVWLVVIVATAVVSAGSVAPAQLRPAVLTATGARDGGKFAFQRQSVDGRVVHIAIYVANPDGTSARRLTSHYNRAGDAAWSPDGSKIAYVTSANPRGIVMNADGSGKRPLCTDSFCVGPAVVGGPAWSPDGRRIAFSRGNGVGIVDADGSDLRFLPTTRQFNVTGLDWSPDGKRLALATSYPSATGIWGYSARIWVINLDGTGLKPLARKAGDRPRWSPDGKTVLFTKDDGSGIYVVRVTGGRPKLIRKTPRNARVPPWVLGSATWSSHGTEIAFFQGHDLHVFRLSDRRDRIITLRPPVCAGDNNCFNVDWQPISPPR
jgi:Tol biopolymer transport system component